MSDAVIGFGANTQAATADPDALRRTIHRIAACGLTHAELNLSRAFAIANGRVIPAQLAGLKRACREGGLAYTVHAPLRINFYDTDHLELQKDVVRSALDITAEVGATLLNVHCGFSPPEVFRTERERLLRLEVETLAELADYASSAGVTLAVENTFPEPHTGDVPDLPTLADQIHQVDSPALCGCLDVSHAALMARICDRDLLEDISAFAPVVGHLHLNDCFARERWDQLMPPSDHLAFGSGDLHLPVGWGGIDWNAVGARLPLTRPTVVILEVASHYWDAGLAESLETARRALRPDPHS